VKRAVAIALLVAGLAAGATVAEAAVRKGTFTGKTSARYPVGLKVSRSGKVYAFYYEGVRLNCTDGDELDTPTGADRIQTPRDLLVRVGSKRRFAIHAENDSTGFGWEAAARFNSRGTKVTGTLSVHARYDEQSDPDPNGSVVCTNDDMHFSLRRR
jgi:hypothetical protein